MRKFLKFAAPVVVLVAGVGSVIALAAAKEAPEKKEEAPRPISLYVEDVRAETVTLSVKTQGEIRPKTEIDLIPQVSGRIISVSNNFSEGAAFNTNATLIKIDEADYQLAVRSAEARLAQAKVKVEQELANAQIKKKQWEEWVKDGDPTHLALNAHQVAEAQAQLQAAETALNTAKLNLARTNITVPFQGRVLERNVGVGQFVNGSTKLGRVFATNIVEIKLPLTDAQLSELQLPIGFVADKNNAPKVTFHASLGGTHHVWDGQIKRVSPSVDKTTRLVYAIAEVNDPYGVAASQGMPLAVGLFVTAEIEGTSPQNALIMPRDALRSTDKVYVISDDKLEIRTVSVLSTTADHVMVTGGVEAGEKVVTSPVQSVFNGMAVQPITRSAANLDNTTR